MPLNYVLNARKKIENYGLQLYGSTYDPAFSQGAISSKPNISIIGSSCFIDYSETFNTSDLSYLKKIFKTTPAGTTFSFNNAEYYDEEKNYITNVNGIVRFETLTNSDKLIIGGVISGFTYTSNYKLYKQENFVKIPQFSTNTDFIYLGNTSGLVGSSFGYALDPGENVFLDVQNTNTVFAISNTGTQVITYMAS